jgi:hypothetical protein
MNITTGVLFGLTTAERTAAHRGAAQLCRQAADRPEVRAAILLAAVQVAKTEGHTKIAAAFSRAMTPNWRTAFGPWRERLRKIENDEAEEAAS